MSPILESTYSYIRSLAFFSYASYWAFEFFSKVSQISRFKDSLSNANAWNKGASATSWAMRLIVSLLRKWTKFKCYWACNHTGEASSYNSNRGNNHIFMITIIFLWLLPLFLLYEEASPAWFERESLKRDICETLKRTQNSKGCVRKECQGSEGIVRSVWVYIIY